MAELLTFIVALHPLNTNGLVDAREFEADLWQLATHPQRRLEQKISRRLRRQLLADYLGLNAEHLVFSKDEHGKPYLKHSNVPSPMSVEFSQSHCVNQFALVMNKQGIAVGIDIEAKDRVIPLQALAQRILTPWELVQFERTMNPHAFLLMRWTIKEAVLKASGLGIRLNLNELESIPLLVQSPIHKNLINQNALNQTRLDENILNHIGLTEGRDDECKRQSLREAGQVHHTRIGSWHYQSFETPTHYYTIAWQTSSKQPVQVLQI